MSEEKNGQPVRRWFKWVLFLSSYTPLFLILAIKNLPGGAEAGATAPSSEPFQSLLPLSWLSLLLIAMVVIANIVVFVFLKLIGPKGRKRVWTVTGAVVPRASDSLNYVVTYIIPFLSFDATKWLDLVAISILLLVVGMIYVNSNLLYVNPMLGVFGYRILEVELRHGSTKKKNTPPGPEPHDKPVELRVVKTDDPPPANSQDDDSGDEETPEEKIVITKKRPAKGNPVNLVRIAEEIYLEV